MHKTCSDHACDIQPYHIKVAHSISLTAKLGQVFSSPNLQAETSKAQERQLRRSHSATSIRYPGYPPTPSLRLPSLKTQDPNGIPWSVALNESLRLSHSPVFPLAITPKRSEGSLNALLDKKEPVARSGTQEKDDPKETPNAKEEKPSTPATLVQIRVQEPTALTTPRQSSSLRVNTQGNILSTAKEPAEEEGMTEEDHPRRSVHLYNMRISHHLRSGSLLSWDTLADGSEVPSPTSLFRDRSFSDISGASIFQTQHGRHERHTSSSGFASSRVPVKWGKVVTSDIREDKSSIYSSRPQSPLDSPLSNLGGSMINLSQAPTHVVSTARSSLDHHKVRRSNSYPTDNDETPKPARKHGLMNLRDVASYSALTQRANNRSQLVRDNSVTSTKKSKFREEFSPSPPKKKLLPSASIMRFFTPKRNSLHIHTEADMKIHGPSFGVDGLLEVPNAETQHERRQSRSEASLEAEQKALVKDKGANLIWERALQNHQDEKAAMLLPENKDHVGRASPFRDRSGSVVRSRTSEETDRTKKLSVAKRFSAPLLDPPSPNTVKSKNAVSPLARRGALTGNDDGDVGSTQNIRIPLAQQSDTDEIVGAWGRYPSHTRASRTFSAGHQDQVETRDFALEAAIRFAMNKTNDNDELEEEIDPTTRPLTPPLLPGQRKRKRKVGSSRIAKSHSMTFGKSFLRNYARIFRSQSIEFQRHGQGHRSSVATGGALEYPELEMVPDVWRAGIVEEANRPSSQSNLNAHDMQQEYGPGDRKGKGKMKEEQSAATPGQLPISSRPTTSNLLQMGSDGSKDTARVWSAYYEGCLPTFPRASTELDFSVEDFGTSARRSLDSRRTSLRSRTMPMRQCRHSRNPSRMSHFSKFSRYAARARLCSCFLGIVSHASGRRSFLSMGDNDGGKFILGLKLYPDSNITGIDQRSMVSVRRSTMDLISMYKEQEDTEMEKVLKMVRTESTKASTILEGL